MGTGSKAEHSVSPYCLLGGSWLFVYCGGVISSCFLPHLVFCTKQGRLCVVPIPSRSLRWLPLRERPQPSWCPRAVMSASEPTSCGALPTSGFLLCWEQNPPASAQTRPLHCEALPPGTSPPHFHFPPCFWNMWRHWLSSEPEPSGLLRGCS